MIWFNNEDGELPVSVMYTLVGREQLLADLPAPSMAVRELKMGAKTLILGPGANGALRINQLLSTDPADFLNPKWQPGTDWQP